jgi:hypothetical protein
VSYELLLQKILQKNVQIYGKYSIFAQYFDLSRYL